MANVNPAFRQPANPELAALAKEVNHQRRQDVLSRISEVDVPVYTPTNAPTQFDDIVDDPPTEADMARLRRMVDASFDNKATENVIPPNQKVPQGGYLTWPPPDVPTRVAPWTDAIDVRKWPKNVRATINDLSNINDVYGTTTRQKVQKACSEYRWAPFFAGWLLFLVVLCLLRYCAFK
jgi:hypothetical protein